MNSIRTKTTLLTVIAILVTTTILTILGATSIRNIGKSSSDEMILLLCETGEKNLDAYFESVEQSVEMVTSFVQSDLDSLEPALLQRHIKRTSEIFEKAAYQTHGVFTYYYRIDPSISDELKGFWYTNEDGKGFKEHVVTDITQYDTEDTNQLVWFTVPKATGKGIWLPPYITDNLDVRVISYNEPIYCDGRFVGVVGMEIDYSVMAEQVNNITLYENGYAFITDNEGTIIYHPRIDVTVLPDDEKPKVPAELLSDDTYIYYNFQEVDKEAVWRELENGMRLYVTVPIDEINSSWVNLIEKILIVFAALLVVFILITLYYTGRITRPLHELTKAAEEVNKGNYDVQLEHKGKDEVGILTHTFNRLIDDLKVYITDLNSLAYADALTSVHNKGAFDIYIRELQVAMDDNEEMSEFAIGIFDCDSLKTINDQYGHDKGDIYLKNASSLICKVFQHSPVFRIGGDEFAVILQNDDFDNREELIRQFEKRSAAVTKEASVPWNEVRVSMGIAIYDAENDQFVGDVSRRADKLMYENKRIRKEREKDK